MYNTIKHMIILSMLVLGLYTQSIAKSNWVPIAVGDVLTFVPYGQTLVTNTIQSTKVFNDNQYLTLTIQGSFVSKSHFDMFINSDNNKHTGYQKTNGSDYLVEDSNLFVYSGDGSNWKWTKISKIGLHNTKTLWRAKVCLSSLELSEGETIETIARVMTEDWKNGIYSQGNTYNIKMNDDIQTLSYTELVDNIKNPERGLYTNHYLASHPYRNLSTVAGKYTWIVDQGYNIFVEKLVLVDDFRKNPISSEYLERVRKDFSFARTNGLKMIVRVTYNEHMGDPDAPLDVILGHINQFKPIYHEYKDVIMSVQAGFIGAWGEWHSSTNGLDKDTHAKDAIKNALLDAVPSSISVQFRNPPEIIRWYSKPLTSAHAYSGSHQSRVGFHDDCFNWNASDRGTFTGNSENIKKQKEYISKSSKFTPFMGETCNEDISHVAASTTSCENALEMAAKLHLTSLGNVFVKNDNITTPVEVYHNEGCWDEIVRRLGYRFVLKSATLPTVTTEGKRFSGEIKIKNDGFASLVNRRNAYIVLENESKRVAFKLNTDPRTWEPNKTISIKFQTILSNSLTEGHYKVALWLPDIHENLKNNSKYAIRTANTKTWNSQKGYNVLGEVDVISSDTLTK